jgi:hypothetical protein
MRLFGIKLGVGGADDSESRHLLLSGRRRATLRGQGRGGGDGKLFGDGEGGRQTLSGWARVRFLSVAVTVAVDTGLGGRSKRRDVEDRKKN